MKCVGGIWFYQGRSYATLHEALVAAWPQALPRAGKKEPPRCWRTETAGRNRFDTHCFCLL